MATKKDHAEDLAQKRHVLRVRIHGDERKLAIAYPEDAVKLREDIEREREMLAELDAQVEEAKEETRQQMRSALDAYFKARAALVKLNGYFQDPGFREGSFTRVHLGAVDAEEPLAVKTMLLAQAQMPSAPEPVVPDHQRVWDERVRNERAGLGPYTDAELKRKDENPIAFAHGAGAKVSR